MVSYEYANPTAGRKVVGRFVIRARSDSISKATFRSFPGIRRTWSGNFTCTASERRSGERKKKPCRRLFTPGHFPFVVCREKFCRSSAVEPRRGAGQRDGDGSLPGRDSFPPRTQPSFFFRCFRCDNFQRTCIIDCRDRVHGVIFQIIFKETSEF